MAFDPKFDPRLPTTISLSCFADWPAEKRPVFIYRRCNTTEWSQLADALLDIDQAGEHGAAITRIFNTLRLGLLDWRHQVDLATGEEVPFDPSKLELLMSPLEAIELANTRAEASKLNSQSKKNSASPSCCGTASCAETAPPANA